jgi:hypothetical protein
MRRGFKCSLHVPRGGDFVLRDDRLKDHPLPGKSDGVLPQSSLRSVAAFPAGSEIVLTFAPPGDSPSPFNHRAATLGEPWVTYFEPGALDAKLRTSGFSKIEFLLPAEAEERYFRQRPKDLPVPNRKNILSAGV